MEAGFSYVRSADSSIGRSESALAREALENHKASQTGSTRAHKFVWPELWPVENIVFIEPDDVLAIHHALTDEFRGTEDAIVPEGIRDRGLLESAVNRPRL